jgi:hypothetical protein
MGEAASRLSAIAEQMERIGENRTPSEAAVFADPVELRLQRDRRRREQRRRSAARARAGRHRR